MVQFNPNFPYWLPEEYRREDLPIEEVLKRNKGRRSGEVPSSRREFTVFVDGFKKLLGPKAQDQYEAECEKRLGSIREGGTFTGNQYWLWVARKNPTSGRIDTTSTWTWRCHELHRVAGEIFKEGAPKASSPPDMGPDLGQPDAGVPDAGFPWNAGRDATTVAQLPAPSPTVSHWYEWGLVEWMGRNEGLVMFLAQELFVNSVFAFGLGVIARGALLVRDARRIRNLGKAFRAAGEAAEQAAQASAWKAHLATREAAARAERVVTFRITERRMLTDLRVSELLERYQDQPERGARARRLIDFMSRKRAAVPSPPSDMEQAYDMYAATSRASLPSSYLKDPERMRTGMRRIRGEMIRISQGPIEETLPLDPLARELSLRRHRLMRLMAEGKVRIVETTVPAAKRKRRELCDQLTTLTTQWNLEVSKLRTAILDSRQKAIRATSKRFGPPTAPPYTLRLARPLPNEQVLLYWGRGQRVMLSELEYRRYLSSDRFVLNDRGLGRIHPSDRGTLTSIQNILIDRMRLLARANRCPTSDAYARKTLSDIKRLAEHLGNERKVAERISRYLGTLVV